MGLRSMVFPVHVRRNHGAGRGSAFTACVETGGAKVGHGRDWQCSKGRNPRVAAAKALRQMAAVLVRRKGAFAEA